MSRFIAKFRNSLGALVLAMLSSTSHAALVNLTIDSSASSITMGGVAFTLNYTQQNAGSLTANYGGTISADLTAGVFTFNALGGSSITAITNPSGPYSTLPNPAGPLAGNYGVTASGFVPVFPFGNSTINGVYRDLILDFLGGTATNGSPLSVGTTIRFTQGGLVAGAATQGGNFNLTSNLAGVSGTNSSLSNVTWDGTTLTIPMQFSTTGSNRQENWNGVIVAKVPEPSSAMLVVVASIAGTAMRRRSRYYRGKIC